MIRRPTLRSVGIVAAVAGAIALAAPFAWTSFWPTPLATIVLPDSRASAGDCFVARGDVAPSTIWQPLWLIEGSDRTGWRPLEKIDPSPGTWQRTICVEGSAGSVYHLALVVADRDRDDAFRSALVEREEEIPDWLKPGGNMEQGGRGRRHLNSGIDSIPKGARLVASAPVAVVDDDESRWSFVRYGGRYDRYDERQAELLLALMALERERNHKHDERRVLRSRGALEVTAHAVPAALER